MRGEIAAPLARPEGGPEGIRQAGSVTAVPSTITWPARQSARACSQEVPGAFWRTSAASVGGPGGRAASGAAGLPRRGFFGTLDISPL
jgi:hypothetical protein